jgi:hypothetical protein
MFGMKYLHFTDHRRCSNCCFYKCSHSSHWQKRFWFTLWKCSAEIFAVSLHIFSFSSSVQGLLQETLSFKQPQKKNSQGLRLGERVGQIPLLIILFPKTSDSLHRQMCSVGSCLVSLKPAIWFLFFCYLTKELSENHPYIYFAINCFIKKHRSNNPCIYNTPGTNLYLMEWDCIG